MMFSWPLSTFALLALGFSTKAGNPRTGAGGRLNSILWATHSRPPIEFLLDLLFRKFVQRTGNPNKAFNGTPVVVWMAQEIKEFCCSLPSFLSPPSRLARPHASKGWQNVVENGMSLDSMSSTLPADGPTVILKWHNTPQRLCGKRVRHLGVLF